MLSVRDLRVSFRTERGLMRAIDGVNFDVAQSEILGLVGESGSGKTVSLLAVMGLINDPNAVKGPVADEDDRTAVGSGDVDADRGRDREAH